MPKSLTINSPIATEFPNFVDLLTHTFSTLKTMAIFVFGAEKATVLAGHLQFDIGEIDYRPLAGTAHHNSKLAHQNSLDAMLMRGF